MAEQARFAGCCNRADTVGRRDKRRGSTLVEGALVALPLITFVLGVVDISFAVFVKSTLLFAVRQSVRYAVTSRTIGGMGQDDSIRTVMRGYSAGLVDALSPNHDGMKQISINYYDPVTLAPLSGAGSNSGGNIVVVSASGMSWAWMFPLLRSASPLHFSVASADIMEASPLGGPPNR